MTQNEILNMVEELEQESKKTVKVPRYYLRNGKMHRRSYDDTVETPRYHALLRMISEARVFPCAECGVKVSYFGLCEGVCESCWGDEI